MAIKKGLKGLKNKLDPRIWSLFGAMVHKPTLWRVTRSSIVRAVAIGLFVAFLPIPFQMILAAGLAILFSANLVLSVLLVWITNPITMSAIFFLCYKLGATLLGTHYVSTFDGTVVSMFKNIQLLGLPLLVGCLVAGSVASLIGSLLVACCWRIFLSFYKSCLKQ